MAYTEFDYKILLTQFKQDYNYQNMNYKNENKHGSDFIYGESISKLREISNRIINRDWKGFLSIANDDSYEEIMLQGLVIAGANCSIHEKLLHAERFISKVDNWAICDSFCYALKDAKAYKVETWNFLMRFIESRKVYERRFLVVMMANYFLADDFINDVLRIIINIDKTDDFVLDAVTSTLAEAFVKYRDLVMGVLNDKVFDSKTHNKTIEKCLDSYRVSDEDKLSLKSLIIRDEN